MVAHMLSAICAHDVGVPQLTWASMHVSLDAPSLHVKIPTRFDASPYPPMAPQYLGRPMCSATMESSEVLSELESDSAFAFLQVLLSAKSRRAMEASDPL